MPSNRSDRRGTALLEAMIALAILSSAGIATVSLMGAALRAEREAQQRERMMGVADRILTAHTLLLRSELDQRLGDRRVGELVVRIARPEATLYRIAVADGTHPDVELLVTVAYRAKPGAQ